MTGAGTVRHEDGGPRWPGTARCAALVTVNFDGEDLLLAEPGMAGRQKTLSVLRYGATRGAARLLDALDGAGLPSTWFTPVSTADRHPGVVRDVARAGHAVGLRGRVYGPLDRITGAERRPLLAEAAHRLGVLAGGPVRGFRLPVGEWPLTLASELADAGIAWSSSWHGDDTPFVLPAGDGRHLVEFPAHHALDDRVAFYWNVNPPIPAGQSRIAPYAEVLDNWLLEFEGCRREGLLFVVQLHPEICGTPGRIGLVEELLATIAGDPAVWRPTGDELAAWWTATHPVNPPGHPADVFFASAEVNAGGRAFPRESEKP